MTLLKRFFVPKELKAALGILAEADQKFNNRAFDTIKPNIEKELHRNSDHYVKALRETEETPQQLVYSLIANFAGDYIESGQNHIYRGVLNPLREGSELIKIYDMSLDELVINKAISKERAEKEKNALRNNIKNIG